MAAMSFKVPPHCGHCSMSISNTRLSNRAQLRHTGATAGGGGAGDVAAQVFQLLALIGGAAHLGMEAEALRVDAARGGQWRLCREGLQAQHFLARPRPEGNAVGAGCRPRGPEREIRIGVGEIAHALLFDEEALARP